MGNQASKQCTDADYLSETYRSDFFRHLLSTQAPAFPVTRTLIDDAQNSPNFIILTTGGRDEMITHQTLNFSVCMITGVTPFMEIFTYKKITFKDFPIIVIQLTPTTQYHINYFLNKCKIFVSINEFANRLILLSNIENESNNLDKLVNKLEDASYKMPVMKIADPTEKPDPQYLFESSARDSFYSYQRALSQSSFSNVMDSSAVMESEANASEANSFISQSSEPPAQRVKPKETKKKPIKRSVKPRKPKPAPPPPPPVMEDPMLSEYSVNEQSTEIFTDDQVELSSISITDSTLTSGSGGLSSQFRKSPPKPKVKTSGISENLSSSSFSSDIQSNPKRKKKKSPNNNPNSPINESSQYSQSSYSNPSSLTSVKSERTRNKKSLNRSQQEIAQARSLSTIPPAPTLTVQKMNPPPRRRPKRLAKNPSQA